MTRQSYGAVLGLSAVLFIIVPVLVQADAAPCASLHTAGSGATAMRICISGHGNVVKFETPAGVEQIRQTNLYRDGYAVCSDGTTHGYDTGAVESAWGATVITQPNGPNTFPLTISRNTADGVFDVLQTFARDPTEIELTITMKVKNLSTSAKEFVRIARYFENDVNNNDSASAWMAKTRDSAWGWSQFGYGLMLTAASFSIQHEAYVESLASFDPTAPFGGGKGCHPPVSLAQPQSPPATEMVGRATYGVGTLKPGATSKPVKFVYRRF